MMLRELFGHLRPRRRRQLVFLLGLMLTGSLMEVVTIGAVVPFITLLARPEVANSFPQLQVLFGSLGWDGEDSLIAPMSAAFLTFVFFAALVRLVLIYASNKLVFAIGSDIGVKLYRVILNQPYAYHIAQNTSEVIGSMNKVQILIGGFLRPTMDGIIALVLSLAILAALMMVDASTAMAAGVMFAAIYLIVIKVFRKRLKHNSKIIADSQGLRVRAVQEGLGGIRDVILDNSQSQYVEDFAAVDGRFRRVQAANAFLSEAPRFVVEFIGIMLIVGLSYAFTSKQGGLVEALPTLGALALGAARLMPLVQKMYAAWAQYSGNYNVLVEVLATLNLPDQQEAVHASPLPFIYGIELRAVGFRYSPDEPEVLTDINLFIPKGSRVGIIGQTGSGKSTLMDIVMGLLKPTHGQILVDGIEIDSHNRVAWRRHIAHVPQHIYLSDASIRQNITLGVAEGSFDQERMRKAAQQAQIAEFIETQRQSYETRVGERGVQLSGGQRQRIGIARALFKEADVLVFDEASSALDSMTEDAVMTAVSQMDRDLTVLIIAHRVGTLRDCDFILRVESRRVIVERRNP